MGIDIVRIVSLNNKIVEFVVGTRDKSESFKAQTAHNKQNSLKQAIVNVEIVLPRKRR